MNEDIIGPGYIQLRRQLVTHLQDGRMTGQEFLVFTILLMLANTQTGCGLTNAAAVSYWTGSQIGIDSADRVLRSLDKKDYIVREIKRGREGLYPYRVQNFELFWRDAKGVEHVRRTKWDRIANKLEEIDELLDTFGAVSAEETAVVMPVVTTVVTAVVSPDDITKDKEQGTKDNDLEKEQERFRPALPSQVKVPYQPKIAKPVDRSKPIDPVPVTIFPDATNLTDQFADATDHWKFKQAASRQQCNLRLGKLLLEHSEDDIAEVIDYAVKHPEYGTGMRTVSKKADPWDWFADRYDEIHAHMVNDADYLKRVARKTAEKTAAITKAKASAVANADKPAYRQVPGSEIVKEGDVVKL